MDELTLWRQQAQRLSDLVTDEELKMSADTLQYHLSKNRQTNDFGTMDAQTFESVLAMLRVTRRVR